MDTYYFLFQNHSEQKQIPNDDVEVQGSLTKNILTTHDELKVKTWQPNSNNIFKPPKYISNETRFKKLNLKVYGY